MGNLNIYIINIISLNTCSQIKLFSLNMSNENITNPLTKGFPREFMYNSLRRMGLNPLQDEKK